MAGSHVITRWEDVLATAIRCFDEGAYRVKGGFLDEDYDQSGQIADLLNGSRTTISASDYA